MSHNYAARPRKELGTQIPDVGVQGLSRIKSYPSMVLIPILKDYMAASLFPPTTHNKSIKGSEPVVLGASKWISHSMKMEKPAELSSVLP